MLWFCILEFPSILCYSKWLWQAQRAQSSYPWTARADVTHTGSTRLQTFLANYYNLQMELCPQKWQRQSDWQRHTEEEWWTARETERDSTWPACWQKATEQSHKLHTVMRGFVMRSSMWPNWTHTNTHTGSRQRLLAFHIHGAGIDHQYTAQANAFDSILIRQPFPYYQLGFSLLLFSCFPADELNKV